MKLKIMAMLAALLTGTMAYGGDMSAADSDGDGMISADEFTAAYPDQDPAVFVAVDVNADGMIDADEFAVAVADGGLLAG